MLLRLALMTILAGVSALPASGRAGPKWKFHGPVRLVVDTDPGGRPAPGGAGDAQPSAAKAVCASTNGSDVSTSGSTNKPDCTPPVAPGAQAGTNTDTGKTPSDPGAKR